ncbi:MAG: SIS domain-containing protein [Bacillota bacterium]
MTETKQEILSQPEVWVETLRYIKEKDPSNFPNIKDFGQIIFTGCGSTFYLSCWAARLYEEVTGIVCRAVPASEIVLFPTAWLSGKVKRLLIAVSRSGETTETIQAAKMFQEGGYGETLVITCYPGSELASVVPVVLETPSGQEKSVVQTRSFTCMMLATIWLLYKDIPSALLETITNVGQNILDISSDAVNRLNNNYEKIFFLGGGPRFGLANECMLKVKEMSLTNTESYHFLEFRHGPMSMVDKRSLVVGLLSGGFTETYEMKVMNEMKALGARTMALTETELKISADAIHDLIAFNSGLPSAWCAPLYLPAAQLMAYERALSKGLDPDIPNNLKAVVRLDR